MEKQGKVAPPPGAPLCASTDYYAHGKMDMAKNGKNAPEMELALPKMEKGNTKNGKGERNGHF